MDRDSDSHSGTEDESSSAIISAYPTDEEEEEKPDVKVDPCLICAQPAVFYSANGNPIKREIPLEGDYTYQQLFSDLCYCLKISRNEDFLQNDSFPFCDQCEVLLVKLSELNMKLKQMERTFRKKIVQAEEMYLKDGLYEKSGLSYLNFRKQMPDLLAFNIQQKKLQNVPMRILRPAQKTREASKTMVDLIAKPFLRSSNLSPLPPSLPDSPIHNNFSNDDDEQGSIDVHQNSSKIDQTGVAGVSKYKLKSNSSTSRLKKRRNKKVKSVKPRLKRPKLDNQSSISSITTREETTSTDNENNDNVKITRSRSHHKRKSSCKTVGKKILSQPKKHYVNVEKNEHTEKRTFSYGHHPSVGHSLTKDLRTGSITYESGFGNRFGRKRLTLTFEKVEGENLKCLSCSGIVIKETDVRKQTSLFRQHLLAFHAGYRQCLLCGEQKFGEELLSHLKDSHNLKSVQSMKSQFYLKRQSRNTEKKQSYVSIKVCDICRKPFDSIRSPEYFHHRLSHLSEEEKTQKRRCRGGWWRPSITDFEIDERYVMCEICGELISDVPIGIGMKNHLRTHLPEEEKKPFLCSICGQRFVNKNVLKKHVSSVHSDGKCGGSNSCMYPSCDNFFQSEEALKEHVTLEHGRSQGAEEKLMCLLCGKLFTSTWGRHQHRLVHSKEKNHECLVCARKFPMKYTLLMHLAAVHSQGELYGKFKCEIPECEYVFPLERQMRKHMRLKHGVFSRQLKAIVGHGTTTCDDAQ